MPKRPAGARFECFELGHQSRDCPKINAEQQSRNQVANMSENFPSGNQQEQISFVSDVSLDRDENGTPRNTLDNQGFRMMTYEFDCKGNTNALSLDTLLDTGSPISFVKESLVPGASVRPYAPESSREYSGINESTLIYLDVASVKVTLDSVMRKFDVFVVPDRMMRASVILGHDALK